MSTLRSGDSVGNQWQVVNGQGNRLAATGAQTTALRQFPTASTNGRLRKQFGRELHFPFRIYQTPPMYLAAPAPATDWLNFCVRGGLICLGTPVAATGTDGETFGYDETYPVTDGLGTGVITATSDVAQFWFWVDVATNAVGSGVTLPPGNIVILGYVDTTDVADQIPHIRQIQYGDIVSPGGGIQWQTPYKEIDPSLAVPVNTLVYVSPDNVISTAGMLDLGGANPGGNTTARSGIWLCVKSVPAQVVNPSGLPAGTYYNVPQLPYPGATGAPTGGAGSVQGDLDGANVFWVFISESPQC